MGQTAIRVIDAVAELADWDQSTFSDDLLVRWDATAGKYVAAAITSAEVVQAASDVERFIGIVDEVDGPIVTFDLRLANKHSVTLGGDRTLALIGGFDGQAFTILLIQDGSGNRQVSWWPNIKWAGGAVPVLTKPAGKLDAFTFIRRSATEYLGFVSGQNF